MHTPAAESDRIADGGPAQGSGREPVPAGATEPSPRRRRQTRPAQRHCRSEVAVVRKGAGGTKQRTRRGKLERVRIDREEVLKLDRSSLPPDVQFKGYEDVVVQKLRIGTDNVKFRKEKYYAPSTGQTYLAPLPAGYRGEFGPNLKSLCLLFSHLCNMTE